MTIHVLEQDNESLVVMPVSRFTEGAPSPCDMFIRENGKVIWLFNKGMLFDASSLSFLREKGITEVFVRETAARELDQEQNSSPVSETPPPDAIRLDEYVTLREEHHQIDKALLVPGSEIQFTLYLLNQQGIQCLIEASEHSPVKLQESFLGKEGDLVIQKEDIPRYQEYLNALVVDKNLPQQELRKIKSTAIKENSKLIVKDLLANPRSGEKIKESIVMVNKMVDGILENHDAIYDLLSIRTYDYYTYTHSVNVATLSVGLGMAAGLDRLTLERLGIGAMMHDLGKSSIPLEILNKPARLTDEEFRIMKTHVLESEKYLRYQKYIPEESYIAVLQHHEKISGEGYPLGLSGQEVKLYGRIAAIADCYDAMTTRRCYQPAMTPFHAISTIVKETKHFDSELLTIFIKMLGKIT
ncbi:MAG: HD-GYP domain-containing protein [Nitrospirota bacterium]